MIHRLSCVCLLGVCLYMTVYVRVCLLNCAEQGCCTCVYVHMYVCMCVCMCMYACMYVCMCACVYACMYVCMCVCVCLCESEFMVCILLISVFWV